MKYLFLIMLSIFLVSCSGTSEEKVAADASKEAPKTFKEENESLEVETKTNEQSVDSILKELNAK